MVRAAGRERGRRRGRRMGRGTGIGRLGRAIRSLRARRRIRIAGRCPRLLAEAVWPELESELEVELEVEEGVEGVWKGGRR